MVKSKTLKMIFDDFLQIFRRVYSEKFCYLGKIEYICTICLKWLSY